jgi:WD40 repeat protein
VAAGFGNGIVRFLNVSAEGLEVMKAFKAHEDAIVGVKPSHDMKMLCTASVTGDIFFYVMDGHKDTQMYEPLCTVKLPHDSCINDFSWNPDDQSVLFGCKNGYVFQVDRPKVDEIDNSDTYYWDNARIKEWTIKIMEF